MARHLSIQGTPPHCAWAQRSINRSIVVQARTRGTSCSHGLTPAMAPRHRPRLSEHTLVLAPLREHQPLPPRVFTLGESPSRRAREASLRALRVRQTAPRRAARGWPGQRAGRGGGGVSKTLRKKTGTPPIAFGGGVRLESVADFPRAPVYEGPLSPSGASGTSRLRGDVSLNP
jgi:hypothetical protein